MSDTDIYILCVETANVVTSIAISKNRECYAVKHITEANKAADILHTQIAEILKENKLNFTNINAIAISAGPGSYTGLRIAAALAKGYCFALDIPLIAIPTLEAMVNGAITRYHQTNIDCYVPMIDARRMEVFTSFYNNTIHCEKYFSSLILEENTLTHFSTQKKYLLFGNGAIKGKHLFLGNKNIIILEDFEHHAADLCKPAYYKFINNKYEDTAYFEPSYYKAVHTTTKKHQ